MDVNLKTYKCLKQRMIAFQTNHMPRYSTETLENREYLVPRRRADYHLFPGHRKTRMQQRNSEYYLNSTPYLLFFEGGSYLSLRFYRRVFEKHKGHGRALGGGCYFNRWEADIIICPCRLLIYLNSVCLNTIASDLKVVLNTGPYSWLCLVVW